MSVRYRFRFVRKMRIPYLKQTEIIKKMFKELFPYDIENKKNLFSFGPAVSMNYLSECEYVDVEFNKRIEEKMFFSLFEKNMPEELELWNFKVIPLYFPSIESSINIIEYEIKFEKKLEDKFVIDNNNCIVAKNENAEVDIRKSIYDMGVKDNIMRLFIDYSFNVKPDIIALHLVKNNDITDIVRKNFYWIDSKNKLNIL